MSQQDYDILIVGAGLAGLSCARSLVQAGLSVGLLDASDGVGAAFAPRTQQCCGQLCSPGSTSDLRKCDRCFAQDATARERTERDVREHLRQWFGPAVKSWKPLEAYSIPYAVPLQQRFHPNVKNDQAGKVAEENPAEQRAAGAVILCGDYTQSSSIQRALLSGRLAADKLVATECVKD